MSTVELPPENPALVEKEKLLELQLSVARRADELSRRFSASRDADRRLWLRAEFEVFERMENANPRAV